MNDEGVYRTAPATPGLLNNISSDRTAILSFVKESLHTYSMGCNLEHKEPPT